MREGIEIKSTQAKYEEEGNESSRYISDKAIRGIRSRNIVPAENVRADFLLVKQ